jgi:hypothetical protein
MTSAAPMIDTSRVEMHRALRFETIDEALAEIDRLVRAEEAGRLKHVGNWTPGQILGHLATWAEYSFTGAPLKPPKLPIRLILKLQKNKFLDKGMPRGVKIPGVPNGTLGTEPIAVDVAAPRCRVAYERLGREMPSAPNIIFGPLTHEEWIKLNLRHAELHLGYLIEQSGP